MNYCCNQGCQPCGSGFPCCEHADVSHGIWQYAWTMIGYIDETRVREEEEEPW